MRFFDRLRTTELRGLESGCSHSFVLLEVYVALFMVKLTKGGLLKMNNIDLIYALEQIEREKGISSEVLISAIESALLSAYKKNSELPQNAKNIKISIDRHTGEIRICSLKLVTLNVTDNNTEISLHEAQEIDPRAEENDMLEQEIIANPKKFGRISGQVAKQVIMQKIREEEKRLLLEEFSAKLGELVIGVIQRVEKKNSIIVDLGKVEAILPLSEQVSIDRYEQGKKIKVLVLDVKESVKGPKIIVSRSHPDFVKRLFEREVPEIQQGILEIRGIGREPGSRTKISVYSKNNEIDPVGACVGQKGIRVQSVVDELSGEKIDIIKWSSSPEEYISSSLSPSKVIRVDIDEENRSAKVTVPDSQLSLAIGKEGQNARLAAKLTGWKIDIKSESQLRIAIERQFLNFEEGDSNLYNAYEDSFHYDLGEEDGHKDHDDSGDDT